MSSEAMIELGRPEAIEDLVSQRAALQGGGAERLVLYCDEPRPEDVTQWEDAPMPALVLRMPAGDATSEAVRDAIHYAASEIGVRELVCIAQVGRAEAKPRLQAVQSATFMERVQAAARRHRQDVEAAKGQVRACVSAITSQVGSELRVTGVVEIGEAGAMLGYVAEDDAFVPII